MLTAHEIGQALQHARFPIRSFDELHDALHEHLNGSAHGVECEIERMAELFSPRDFLFTNAEQVRRLVAVRQGDAPPAVGYLH